MRSILKKLLSAYFFFTIITFTAGIIIGHYTLPLLLQLNLEENSEHHSFFGLNKPAVLGFYPHWTFNKNKTYSDYLNEFCYFSLSLNPNGTIQKMKNVYQKEPGWALLQSDDLKDHLQTLKENDNKLSLLIHLSNQQHIEALLENPQLHAQNLITEIKPIIKKFNFDDLNLDIEYFQKVEPSFQNKFTQFVAEIKKELNQQNLATLTIDIMPIALVETRMTNIKNIEPLADHLVLMSYDYHYIYSYLSGPVAPVGGAGIQREYDIEKTLEVLLKTTPQEKIYLGIPLYGYSWKTISNKPHSPVIPNSATILTSSKIEKFLTECNDCQKKYDRYSKQPYIIYKPENKNYYQQIFFEDQTSLQEKLTLVKKYRLHGVALWAMGYEDKTILKPLTDFKNLKYFHPSI
jgi:spore germination protein YaaH